MAKLAIAFLILCSLITRSEFGVTAVRASDFSSLDGGSETPEASRMRGWIAGADLAELVRADAISPNRNGIKIASMIAVPPSAASVLGVDGANDFSLAYVIQALTYSLIATGDPHLGEQIVDRSDAMLAERDATTEQGHPFGWLDRSPGVDRPYAWGGFTGHNFAPLMHFAQIVLNNPALGQKTYKGRSFHDHAVSYMNEFKAGLEIHSNTDLVQQQGFAYFRLPSNLPVKNRGAPGSPYPPNLNAALFSSILHLSCAEEREGIKAEAARQRKLVDGFVAFMKERVLAFAERNGRETLVWDYSSYIKRREDVGHANNVVKFLIEAHEAGYAVDQALLRRLANTADLLMQPDGTVQADLIDGTNYTTRLARSVYYFILLGKYSENIEAKVAVIRRKSNLFAYQGAALYTLTDKPALDASCNGRPT